MGERTWHPEHVAAGYHEVEWEVPPRESVLVGEHKTADGDLVTVRWLEVGPTGLPELALEIGVGGPVVTVLSEDVASLYLEAEGCELPAVFVEQRDARRAAAEAAREAAASVPAEPEAPAVEG
jgi:hypothetical protein